MLLAGQALAAAQSGDAAALAARGIAYRDQGHLQQSIETLEAAARQTSDAAVRARVLGELGISLLQARRLDEAEEALLDIYEASSGTERARYSVYLGNLAVLRKSPSEAVYYFEEARTFAGGDTGLQLNAGLNLARLAPEGERLALLEALSRRAAQAEGDRRLAPHHINLGDQARALGAPGLALAYRHLERGRTLAEGAGDARLAAEAGDALAQLYEDQRRHADALVLTRQALQRLRPLDPAATAELLIALEWRQARLLAALGRPAEALAAYERTVHQVETVRQDIPIEYADGRSSFTETLEPIYLGYVDLLLKRIDRQAPAGLQLQTGLGQVRDVVELVKQTELQDFMGDRCAVEAVQGGGVGQLPPGSAVLYPIILRDRLELLLQTPVGLSRRSVAVDSTVLRRVAAELADKLRNERSDYLPDAQQLYDWLLRPVQAELARHGVRSLVVVPDGPLRLVPLAALHDGRQFALEQYALSVTTGMTMTNSRPGNLSRVSALMVGLSEPGPVLAKLSPALATQILQSGGSAGETVVASRSLGGQPVRTVRSPRAGSLESIRSVEELRDRLALPGVKDEIEALGHLMPGKTLLNAEFTLDNFRDEAKAGDYRVLHIASHGVFGGSADTSYIMAYDNLLTMDGLQSLLQSEKFQKNPIELLSLSACQTAEGNERAPLGMSGAAIKARAKSVLGTLWPVEDSAARQLMEQLYGGLSRGAAGGKSEALRQAQLALLRQPGSSHPYFWAPFVLVGNWL